MHSPKLGTWFGLLATLDSGSNENWISATVVERLKLEVTKGLLQIYLNFEGSKVASGDVVQPTWNLEGRGVSHVTEFRVANNAPFDVLFGRNLLCSDNSSLYLGEEKLKPVLMNTKPPQVRVALFSVSRTNNQFQSLGTTKRR